MKSPFGFAEGRFVVAALLVAACQVGCSAPTPPEEVSTVRVTITVVPADVSCINLTAAGTTRTVERTFDVTAGASSSAGDGRHSHR